MVIKRELDRVGDRVLVQTEFIGVSGQVCSVVYELTGPATKTYERCRNNLDRLNGEIELLIRKAWPSHRPDLRRLGLG